MRANVQNLGNYKGPAALIDGTYIVQVTSAELIHSKIKGTPGLSLSFQIQDGPEQPVYDLEGNTASFAPPNGRFIYSTLWLPSSEQSDGGVSCGRRLREACEAASVDYDAAGFEVDDFLGKSLKVTTKLTADLNGQPRAEVNRYKKL
jgi:hypothetical protein